MKRLLILAPALLLALPAVAQDAPEVGYQNLWCHYAFVTTAGQIPPLPEDLLAAAHSAGAAATPEQLELLAAESQIQQITDGIPALLETAAAGYTEAGFTTEQFDAAKAELEPKVSGQVMGTSGEQPQFAFEDCLVLLPATETTTQ
jgi:hypothetical protein